MAEYIATVRWRRAPDARFIDNRYSRAHRWIFDGGAEIPASSSPHVVRVPLSDPSGVDPEEAFVASLASCHMLVFLSIAAKRGFMVDAYTDNAHGIMTRNAEGRLAITRVALSPEVTFIGDRRPSSAEIEAMHHAAHDECFIANSVRSEVACNPIIPEE